MADKKVPVQKMIPSKGGGGPSSALMKKVGRNMARAMNQKKGGK